VELEPRPFGSEEPCHALGMTMAIKRACSAFGQSARRIPWVLTDVANERHRVDEWYRAQQRQFQAFSDDLRHDQPLLKTGDVGAASAPLLLVMAAVSWKIGSARGDCALIAAHSDGPERGALCASVAT
jgi:3-oxoacyl-[acyl-carrier-protein] synthase I